MTTWRLRSKLAASIPSRSKFPPHWIHVLLTMTARTIVLAVICGLVVSSQPGLCAQESFSVMTWNLEWFFDDQDGDNYSKLAKEKTSPSRPQWNWKRDAVAASIAKVQPDVVALQEVENRRVLWYLTRALDREEQQKYTELGIESADHFTEQDVGFLFRAPTDVLSISQRMQTRAMKASEKYFDLSKHLLGVFQVPVGSDVETVTILNVHLRARAEAEPLRIRQCRLLHQWIRGAIEAGENVIVLGDFNTEETSDETRPNSDVAVACGLHTSSSRDDLVDLYARCDPRSRDTHLLGKAFDRILVSPELIRDTPGRKDLVFESITVRHDLSIRGERDTESQHWDNYWSLPDSMRDLSDHYPVIAEFKIR